MALLNCDFEVIIYKKNVNPRLSHLNSQARENVENVNIKMPIRKSIKSPTFFPKMWYLQNLAAESSNKLQQSFLLLPGAN